jgi:hypothetical protein
VRIRIGFIWLRTGSSSGQLWTVNGFFGSRLIVCTIRSVELLSYEVVHFLSALTFSALFGYSCV